MGDSEALPFTPEAARPSDGGFNAPLPLITPCPGFYPRWLTWQLEQGEVRVGVKATISLTPPLLLS